MIPYTTGTPFKSPTHIYYRHIMAAETLDQISFRYQVDKNPRIGHNYVPAYTALFEGDKRASAKRVLEIGIGASDHQHVMRMQGTTYCTGNSLRCWRDYFKQAQAVRPLDPPHPGLPGDLRGHLPPPRHADQPTDTEPPLLRRMDQTPLGDSTGGVCRGGTGPLGDHPP